MGFGLIMANVYSMFGFAGVLVHLLFAFERSFFIFPLQVVLKDDAAGLFMIVCLFMLVPPVFFGGTTPF